jgi:hypothetical protein
MSIDDFAESLDFRMSLESFFSITTILNRDIMLDGDWGEAGSSHSIFVPQVDSATRHGIL